jgi:hypothetical protein
MSAKFGLSKQSPGLLGSCSCPLKKKIPLIDHGQGQVDN